MWNAIMLYNGKRSSGGGWEHSLLPTSCGVLIPEHSRESTVV